MIALFRSLTFVFLLFNMLLLVLEFYLLNRFIRIAATGSVSPDENASFAPIAAP